MNRMRQRRQHKRRKEPTKGWELVKDGKRIAYHESEDVVRRWARSKNGVEVRKI